MGNNDKSTSASPSAHLRVRVRMGHNILLERAEDGHVLAHGGDWIEVDPAELNAPAFAAAVQTEEQIAAESRAVKKSDDGKRKGNGAQMFAALRNAAELNNKSNLDAKRQAARIKVEMMGGKTAPAG